MDSRKLIKIKRWMKRDLSHHPQEYFDCGEVNATKLAENVAQAMELYEGDDDKIPEEVFDIAAEVALEAEKMQVEK